MAYHGKCEIMNNLIQIIKMSLFEHLQNIQLTCRSSRDIYAYDTPRCPYILTTARQAIIFVVSFYNVFHVIVFAEYPSSTHPWKTIVDNEDSLRYLTSEE